MDRVEIRLAGSGGQGLILGMRILFRALTLEGKRAAQSQSYEPTSRGGFCYSDLIVTDDVADYPLATGLDHIAALDQLGIDRSAPLVKRGAIVVVDKRLVASVPPGLAARALPLGERAVAIGSPRVANIVALGALCALSGVCRRESLEQAVKLETPRKFADLNLAALHAGFELAGKPAFQPTA